MQVEPGLFVSNTSTDEWEHDPEVGGDIHVLCTGVGVEAGMSRFTEVDGPVSYTPPKRETLVVLEGTARIELATGTVIELKPGDLASLPAGTECVWHITPPFKEFWIIA